MAAAAAVAVIEAHFAAAAAWCSAVAVMSWPLMLQQAACLCMEMSDVLLNICSQQCLISSLRVALEHAATFLHVAYR